MRPILGIRLWLLPEWECQASNLFQNIKNSKPSDKCLNPPNAKKMFYKMCYLKQYSYTCNMYYIFTFKFCTLSCKYIKFNIKFMMAYNYRKVDTSFIYILSTLSYKSKKGLKRMLSIKVDFLLALSSYVSCLN